MEPKVCGIIATLARNINLTTFVAANSIRGRDSWGFWTSSYTHRSTERFDEKTAPPLFASGAALAALRAEPTTEYVMRKAESDVQPFECGDWVVVHNGTIANDKELWAMHN